MATHTVLRPDELSAALAGLPAWSGDGSGIWRDVRRVSMLELADLVGNLAAVAEELEEEVGHQVEVEVHWRSRRLSLGVGVTGGVTAHDVAYARQVDASVDLPLPADRSPLLQAAIDQIDRQFGRARRPGPGRPEVSP